MATDLLPADTAAAACPNNRMSGSASFDREQIVEKDGKAEQGSQPETSDAAVATANRSLAAVLSDYLQLTKPRIVVMILVTTCATAMIGATGSISGGSLVWLLVGTAAVAGSAGAANQVWERVIDRRMTRTANRPIPSGRVRTGPAVLFTAFLGLAGTYALAASFGVVPAAVGVATWLLYVLVYTPMKIRTAWNTTVGAVAGAIPVLIGYTATGGTLTNWTGWLLVGVLVAWQYPHFMSIAWIYRRQYGEAGFKMTTTEEPTGRSAGLQSICGSAVLIGLGVTLCCLPVGVPGAIIGSLAVTAAAWPMLIASVRFARCPDDATARRLLRSSLLVLPAVLAVVTLRLFW